ncbi:class I SAM-dependent methyltransferase [Lysinibacillus sp. NPDC096418]|uniref:class I SAM-dependent methyltransferase n=1 Tax=Lysinibacillus sp. NPDC096418 TaxID=3364138 RepID=UPI003819ADDC
MNCNGEIIVGKNGNEIIECNICGFKHVYPYPKNESIAKLYTEEYYEKAQPEYIKKVEEDKVWWLEVYQERIKQISNYVENKQKVNVLDIGSGTGYFLLAAKEEGWIETGVEPSIQAYNYSKNQALNVHNEFFSEELIQELPLYDVIHMNHVLEHVPHPQTMLKLIWNQLKPGGIFCVAVPNDFNPFQNMLVKDHNYEPWWVSPLEHVNYFDFKSLTVLLGNNGFEVIDQYTSFPMELFLLMGDKFVGNSELGRECHFKRKTFEMSLLKENNIEVKQNLYKAFASSGLGRDVILFARKPKV